MPTALPAASEWTGSTVTEGQFKTAQNNLRQYLADLLGTDGTIASALAQLKALVNDTVALSGAYTVTSADRGKVLLCSGTWTMSLTAAATLGDGFCCALINTGAGTITIDPASTETIDGATTITLGGGESALLVCTGAAWRSLFRGGTAKVSSNDTTAGHLNGKLVAGSGISFAENNDGGAETLTIASPSASSAVQSAANVGTGTGLVFRDKTGTQLNFRTLAVFSDTTLSQNDIPISNLAWDISGDLVRLRYRLGTTPSGACFIPGTLVRLHSGDWRPIEEISEGDLLDGGPYGPSRVLGIHRPKLGARWLWDLGPVRITGDHLVLLTGCRWGCVEPTLYARLREAQWVEIEREGERQRIRSGAVPAREIDMIRSGEVAHGGVTIPRVMRVRESDPDQTLIGLWTDTGAYTVQGGLVVDGFPQW